MGFRLEERFAGDAPLRTRVLDHPPESARAGDSPPKTVRCQGNPRRFDNYILDICERASKRRESGPMPYDSPVRERFWVGQILYERLGLHQMGLLILRRVLSPPPGLYALKLTLPPIQSAEH